MTPNELEENQSINLTCRANVGSPRRNIKIWKMSQYLTPELISNSSNHKTDNCTETITITFNVTRDDNGALFRCSSHNSLTAGASRDSPKISVFCMYKLLDTTIICVDFLRNYKISFNMF